MQRCTDCNHAIPYGPEAACTACGGEAKRVSDAQLAREAKAREQAKAAERTRLAGPLFKNE